MLRSTFCVLLLFFARIGAIHAQWSIASHITPGVYGVLYFKDGVLWAGTHDLFYSKDSGKTWTQTPLSTRASYDGFCDISFSSRDTGMVSTYYGQIYITHDRGKTWFQIGSGVHVSYFAPDEAIAVNWYSVLTTIDGGLSWATRTFTAFTSALSVSSNRTAYILGGSSQQSPARQTNHLFRSTDAGVTWRGSWGVLDGDTWSLAIDSCDSTRLYSANENFIFTGDSLSKTYVTSDEGMSWNVAFSQPRPYLTGALTETKEALFAPTVANGIMRSVDKGMTWKNIGGPNICYDSKALCAFNSNVLFALDTQGNVWATQNAGGDSVLVRSGNAASQIDLSRTSLSFSMTGCGDVNNAVVLSSVSCDEASLDSIWIFGSTAFHIRSGAATPRLLGSNDSIVITYGSNVASQDSAQLNIRFHSNGGSIRDTVVTLVGVSSPRKDVWGTHKSWVSSNPDAHTSIPFQITSPTVLNIDSLWPLINDLTLTVTIDTALLQFESYTAPVGWIVRSISYLDGQLSFTIHKTTANVAQPIDLGSAVFHVLSQSSAVAVILPVSLVLGLNSGSESPCLGSGEGQEWLILVSTAGVRSAEEKQLYVFPNPATNILDVRNTTLQKWNVKLIDGLGNEIISTKVEPAGIASLSIESLPTGPYEVVIQNDRETIVRRIAVVH